MREKPSEWVAISDLMAGVMAVRGLSVNDAQA